MRVYALEELVLGEILRDRAAAHGSRTFLKLRDGALSYAELDRLTDRMARGFAARGLRQHEHVSVMLPNGPDFLLVIFALARLGAVAVPVNPAYKGELLRHVLATSDSSLLVADESLLDRVAPAVDDRLSAVRAVVVRTHGAGPEPLPKLRKPVLSLDQLLDHGDEPPEAAVRHHDLQAVMYTSGTTGPSKGVMVPHAHALTDAQDFLRFTGCGPDDTIYCPLPLFHAAALWDAVMGALLAGASVAVVERFSASRFWSDVRRFRATLAMGVFSMIPILLSRPPAPTDRDHPLRAFYHGKSALDAAFRARFGVRSVETYTSTEVGIATGSDYGRWRAGSCGEANRPTHEVRVVDAWDREVGPGEPGELVVRPTRPFAMTPGYYKDPAATAESMRNLWFHTGDCAYRDADGFFYFLDRKKDAIRRRGESISAFEVERAVNAHPAVLESAAFAVPSELEEDEVKVAVVLRPGASLTPAELSAWSREQLPAFMAPRYIELLGELPRTATGKIAKHELRRRGDRGITPRTWDRERAERRSGVARLAASQPPAGTREPQRARRGS